MKKIKIVFLILLLTLAYSLPFIGCREAQNNLLPYDPKPNNSDGYNKTLADRPGYALVEMLSDEFNGTSLDQSKWIDSMTYWEGRGAEFLPSNISVGKGYLQLKSSIKNEAQLQELYSTIDYLITGIHKTIDINAWTSSSYGTNWNSDKINADINNLMSTGIKAIGAAAIMSKQMAADSGYYEARIKASKLCMSSAFWLQGGGSEFDITESFGDVMIKTSSWHLERPYLISTSIWDNNAKDSDPQLGGVNYKIENKTSDEFFVLGFKWGIKEVIVYYNDKEIMRKRLDTNPAIPFVKFASKKFLIFDTEILNGPWVGWPSKNDLIDPTKNVFYIDWVRVWKQKT